MTKQEAISTVKTLLDSNKQYLHHVYCIASHRPDWDKFFKPEFFIHIISIEKYIGIDLETKIGKNNTKMLKNFCNWMRDCETRLQELVIDKWEDIKLRWINDEKVPAELLEEKGETFFKAFSFLFVALEIYCWNKNINSEEVPSAKFQTV